MFFFQKFAGKGDAAFKPVSVGHALISDNKEWRTIVEIERIVSCYERQGGVLSDKDCVQLYQALISYLLDFATPELYGPQIRAITVHAMVQCVTLLGVTDATVHQLPLFVEWSSPTDDLEKTEHLISR